MTTNNEQYEYGNFVFPDEKNTEKEDKNENKIIKDENDSIIKDDKIIIDENNQQDPNKQRENKLIEEIFEKCKKNPDILLQEIKSKASRGGNYKTKDNKDNVKYIKDNNDKAKIFWKKNLTNNEITFYLFFPKNNPLPETIKNNSALPLNSSLSTSLSSTPIPSNSLLNNSLPSESPLNTLPPKGVKKVPEIKHPPITIEPQNSNKKTSNSNFTWELFFEKLEKDNAPRFTVTPAYMVNMEKDDALNINNIIGKNKTSNNNNNALKLIYQIVQMKSVHNTYIKRENPPEKSITFLPNTNQILINMEQNGLNSHDDQNIISNLNNNENKSQQIITINSPPTYIWTAFANNADKLQKLPVLLNELLSLSQEKTVKITNEKLKILQTQKKELLLQKKIESFNPSSDQKLDEELNTFICNTLEKMFDDKYNDKQGTHNTKNKENTENENITGGYLINCIDDIENSENLINQDQNEYKESLSKAVQSFIEQHQSPQEVDWLNKNKKCIVKLLKENWENITSNLFDITGAKNSDKLKQIKQSITRLTKNETQEKNETRESSPNNLLNKIIEFSTLALKTYEKFVETTLNTPLCDKKRLNEQRKQEQSIIIENLKKIYEVYTKYCNDNNTPALSPELTELIERIVPIPHSIYFTDKENFKTLKISTKHSGYIFVTDKNNNIGEAYYFKRPEKPHNDNLVEITTEKLAPNKQQLKKLKELKNKLNIINTTEKNKKLSKNKKNDISSSQNNPTNKQEENNKNDDEERKDNSPIISPHQPLIFDDLETIQNITSPIKQKDSSATSCAATLFSPSTLWNISRHQKPHCCDSNSIADNEEQELKKKKEQLLSQLQKAMETLYKIYIANQDLHNHVNNRNTHQLNNKLYKEFHGDLTTQAKNTYLFCETMKTTYNNFAQKIKATKKNEQYEEVKKKYLKIIPQYWDSLRDEHEVFRKKHQRTIETHRNHPLVRLFTNVARVILLAAAAPVLFITTTGNEREHLYSRFGFYKGTATAKLTKDLTETIEAGKNHIQTLSLSNT